MKVDKKYKFEITKPEKTGLRLVKLTNKETNVTTSLAEFNKDFDVHATIAWAGARTSRSDSPFEEIFTEIHEAFKDSKYTAGEKLAKVFVGYGHASVADMSPVMIYLNNIPLYQVSWIFNHTSVGAGQELSTRYVKIGDFKIPKLSKLVKMYDVAISGTEIKKLDSGWESLQKLSSEKYNKWYPKIRNTLENFLKKHADKINPSTLDARTLDIVRMFLPSGLATSLSLLTSTRNWIDIIVQLRSVSDKGLNLLGDQLNTLLNISGFDEAKDVKADLGGLTLYSEGKATVARNLLEIKALVEERGLGEASGMGHQASVKLEVRSEKLGIKKEKLKIKNTIKKEKSSVALVGGDLDTGVGLLAQYISLLYPALDEKIILEFLENLDNKDKAELGRLVLNEHTHHNLMRNAGDIRGNLFVLKTTFAYARDLNRHRAMGRLLHFYDSENIDEIVYEGFNLNYQMQNTKCFTEFEKEFHEDMAEYYVKLYEFYETFKNALPQELHHLIKYILPLGHQVKMHMSGPITQFNYMNSLRIALGGDFGYRDLVYQILERLRQEPFMKSMLTHLAKPDPNNVEQILGRS